MKIPDSFTFQFRTIVSYYTGTLSLPYQLLVYRIYHSLSWQAESPYRFSSSHGHTGISHV